MNRLRALLAAELRAQWRYGIPVVLLVLAAAWTILLAVLPAATAQLVAPHLLFVEIVTVGVLVVGALTMTAKATGAVPALAATPARPWERLTARLLPLTVLTIVCAAPVLVAGRLFPGPGRDLGLVRGLVQPLAAAGLAALLLLAVATVTAVRRNGFLAFLTAVPWALFPLLAVPLAVSAGVLTGPVWYAVPTTGALALFRGDSPYPPPILLAYLAIWAAGTCWFATRPPRERAPAQASVRAGWAKRLARTRLPAAFSTRLPPAFTAVRADLLHVARDAMLAPLAASPILLGLALRFGEAPVTEWLWHTHAVDLAPYLPVTALLAVLLHGPLSAGMAGALVVLDDLESGALRVVAASPLGVGRYLAYRIGLVTAASAAGLAIAAPLSGLVPGDAWAAVALAIPLGPMFLLTMLSVAGSRVQGVTAAKLLGLPAYGAIAAWWITAPAGWLLAALPGFWVVRSWNGAHPVHLLGGALITAAWIVLLTRRTLTRLRSAR